MAMHEVLRTTDPVTLSFAKALLDEAGLPYFSADEHISSMEGSINVFPRRLMVLEDDWASARRVLADGGLERWLIRS